MKKILTQKLKISALSLFFTTSIFSDVTGNEVNGTFEFEFAIDTNVTDKKYFVILDFLGARNHKVNVVYRMVNKAHLIVNLEAGNGTSFEKVKNGMRISQSPNKSVPTTTELRIQNAENYESDYGWTNTTAWIRGLTLVLPPEPLVTIFQGGGTPTYSRADLKEIKIQALPRLLDELTTQFNDKKITKAEYTKKKKILIEITGQVKPIDDKETLKVKKKELEANLKELNALFRKGLITKEEYAEKKKALLDAM